MNILNQLNKLNHPLLKASTPGGAYKSVNIRNKVAYIAIQFPIVNDEFLYLGRLGKEITTEEGVRAMEICALNVLAQIVEKIGQENILGLNHIDAYYQSVDGWDDAPIIVDGASDLFVNVLGVAGHHSRAIFGVHKLPRNFSVGLTVSLSLKS